MSGSETARATSSIACWSTSAKRAPAMAAKPSPVEAEQLIATVRRGETGEIRVRFVRLLTGLEFVDVRLWKKGWRGHVPGKGLALLPSEVPQLAAALEKAAKK